MNILIGLDGSPNSFEAVQFLARFINPASDNIGLAHSSGAVSFNYADANEAIIDRAQKAVAQVIFDEALTRLPAEMHSRVKTFNSSERPSALITNSANSWPAEMIVVGAKGLNTLEQLLIGSVSSEVARGATQPVLVARENANRNASKDLKVLIAYDSSNGERVATFLNKLTFPAGSVGKILTVIESYYYAPLPKWLLNKARDADTEAMSQVWIKEHEKEASEKKAELTSYLPKLPTPFQSAAPMVLEGNAAERILQTIESEKIDLVIVGKQISGMLDRFILGSTSEKVLKHANCSVLIIPGK